MNTSFPLAQIEGRLPDTQAIVGYGSVFAGHEVQSTGSEKSMYDLILAVENALHFHLENLSRNPKDYSRLGRLIEAEGVSGIQKTAGGIYYNPFVPIGGNGEDRQMKYGIITVDDLISTLTDWSHGGYVAGRLAKPSEIFKAPSEVRKALQENLRHHVTTALTLLPETFTLEEFFLTIIKISYIGDIRNLGAEDPDKPRRILHTGEAFQRFVKLYLPMLEERSDTVAGTGDKKISDMSPTDDLRQNVSREVTSTLLQDLPSGLQGQLSEPRTLDRSMPQGVEGVQRSVRTAIFWNAAPVILGQTLKGVVSSDQWIKYAMKKLEKGRKKSR